MHLHDLLQFPRNINNNSDDIDESGSLTKMILHSNPHCTIHHRNSKQISHNITDSVAKTLKIQMEGTGNKPDMLIVKFF